MSPSRKGATTQENGIQKHLRTFVFEENRRPIRTIVTEIELCGTTIPVFTNEFWTSKQRQAHSLHEVSYRACFKPQLPRFFIEQLTSKSDVVYDPFSGRGTTVIEAALSGRNIIANDINPLSTILARPRLSPPTLQQISDRLEKIPRTTRKGSEVDLSMFYHKKTLSEIHTLKEYLASTRNDSVNAWIRMVATNRLTGHSKGFFSVYSLPPNQAMSRESQVKVNRLRNQRPEYRDTHALILKKSKQLLNDLNDRQRALLNRISKDATFLKSDARKTQSIKSSSVQLTVTSPPFLDIVQYAQDNWLRCWFNEIDADRIGQGITMSKTIGDWVAVMGGVFDELYRITKKNGWVAFEVGEVRKGKVRLEEYVAEMGMRSGFDCKAIMINSQEFTKTANIWGISNNSRGTNTNRIVIFKK